MLHLVVVYCFQRAAADHEKLALTEALMDAVLVDLAAVSRGQLCLIVGDLNIEPIRIPCLLKGISAGSWFDLPEAWACASGIAPSAANTPTGGTRRAFAIGCPSAAVAPDWCKVLGDRSVPPHHAVGAAFRMEI